LGNRLTLGQVTDVINGAPVWGPPKDIKEVQNAWQAYNELDNYDPWSIEDLLKAHSLMTSELIGESGAFRSVDRLCEKGSRRGGWQFGTNGSETRRVPVAEDLPTARRLAG
jgi:Fic family protein